MDIRLATLKDVPSIVKMEEECFILPWKEKDVIYEIEENPISTVLVIEEKGAILGYMSYWITFDSATIAQIAIAKAYQGQHLANLLMEEMIDDCYAKRVQAITLEVRVSNYKAINLYHKYGFKDIVLKPHYYDNGEDAIYMVRKEVIS
ncbi:MAG: ribosomal protein S18-alanine N-acetyltransferase [Bacilli bacterium]|nr:ribosomal protein S18-alanine N-acetyltransferase [Bacilli bacterium]